VEGCWEGLSFFEVGGVVVDERLEALRGQVRLSCSSDNPWIQPLFKLLVADEFGCAGEFVVSQFDWTVLVCRFSSVGVFFSGGPLLPLSLS